MLKFIGIFILFFILFNIIPKYPYLFVSKATKLINEGKYEEGLAVFNKAAGYKKVDYMTKIRYAFTELKFGDIKKAKYQIMLILEDNKAPKNIHYEAKAVFALIQFKEGNLEDSKETMQDVYENYKTTNMYCTLGYLYNILEKPENAIKFNEEAYEYNGDKAVIIDNLGQSYYLNNENDKAFSIYSKLMEQKPNFPEAYYNFGLVKEKKGDIEGAKDLFETALSKPFNKLTTVSYDEIENHLNNL